MRDILTKVTTGSMIAGAALLVAACGGRNAANNTATTDMGNDVIDGRQHGRHGHGRQPVGATPT